MQTSAADLRPEIERAFAGRAHPGAERVCERSVVYPTYEGNRVAAFFAQREWSAVTLEALEDAFKGQYRSVIFLLWSEAFQYFLPAFLAIALDVDRALDMADALSFALTQPKEGIEEARWFHARVDTLSPAERQAVTDVLRYLAERYPAYTFPDNPARRALDSYWERPTT